MAGTGTQDGTTLDFDAISQFTPQPRQGRGAGAQLRFHARRMLVAAAHTAGADVIVPRTAAAMAKLHYAKVSRGHIKRASIAELTRAGETFDNERLGAIVIERAERAQSGFGAWLEAEATRNDGALVIAERTERAAHIAGELYVAGVVTDPKVTRWEIGEDPYVIGEALDAGAHWVATGNLATIKPGAMERWLDEAQAKGRFTHVPRPFILEPDAAVETLLERAGVETHEAKITPAMALAHRLVEAEGDGTSIEAQIAVLAHCAEGLGRAGLDTIAAPLGQWTEQSITLIDQGRREDAWRDLETMRRMVPSECVSSALEAETRRRAHEAQAGTWLPPHAKGGGYAR